MRKLIILSLIISSLALMSCKAAPKRTDDLFEKPQMTVKEQEARALEDFQVMLESTAELKRQEAVPLLAKGYAQVIEDYPASFLAEESYYRMMLMNLRDYTPPREAEAEEVYREYFKKYKNPRIGMAMNGDLARYYYSYRRWEKLAMFTTPFMREYVKSGKYGDTLFLFLYSEAKYFLKDYNEARKGYLIIKKNFKGKRDEKVAEERLEAIEALTRDGKAR